MGIKLGGLGILDVKVGAQQVSKIMMGTIQVWPEVDAIPPSVPTELAASNTNPNTISWSASTDNVTPQGNIQYYVQRADNIGFTTNLTIVVNWATGNNEIDAGGLMTGSTYYYRIKARDEALNESAYSTPISSTILQSDSIYLGWDLSSNVTACAAPTDLYYYVGDGFETAITLWDDSSFLNPSPVGYYSDNAGSGKWRYWTGTAFTTGGFC